MSAALPLRTLRAWLGPLCLFLIAGCSETQHDFEVLPTPPSLNLITSSVATGDPFRLHTSWTAVDRDGFVTGYQYATDPPAEFSEEEIGTPVAGDPGLIETFIPGSGDTPDRTRVSKEVQGRTVFFDWIHTQATEHTFTFTTPEAETDPDGEATGRFTGMHAVYVRALDNDGLRSVPAHVAVTAETVAPVTTIASPRIGTQSLITAGEISVIPTGEDPDNPRGPVAYRYKLVVTTKAALLGETLAPGARSSFLDPADWLEVPALSPLIELSLRDDTAFYFAAVAVDEAGPVEPFLELGRNVFGFVTSSSVRGPMISLSEPALGVLTAAAGAAVLAEVSNTTPLELTVNCSAERYGGLCEGIRWGVDLEDPTHEEGWSAWTDDPILPNVVFPEPGEHLLYVQVRDDLGRRTTERFRFSSIEMTFENEALFIDDSRNTGTATDAKNDAFWISLFENSGRFPESVAQYEVYGDRDISQTANHPRLSLLGKHRLLVWDVVAGNFHQVTSLLHATTMTPNLAMYLRAGGTLWIDGLMVLAAMDLAPAGHSDFTYPKSISPDTFPWNFLHMRSDNVAANDGSVDNDKLWNALPWPNETEIYPLLEASAAKLNAVQFRRGGITFAEAFFSDLVTDDELFRGKIDRVYGYGAAGPILFDHVSSFHDRLLGFRWHDPDPARTQGRIQYFGFPLYYFETEQVQETFNRTMDWFREEWTD